MSKLSKTLTIFIFVIVILLVSATAISFFLYQKEAQTRQTLEIKFKQSQDLQMKLQGDLTEAKKQISILQDKNKEADKKLSDAMDELELEQSVKEEVKKENETLKESLESENKSKEKLREDLSQELETAQQRVRMIEDKLKAEQDRGQQLDAKIEDLQNKNRDLENKLTLHPMVDEDNLPKNEEPKVQEAAPSPDSQSAVPASTVIDPAKEKVQLDTIVVNPVNNVKGKVLSVDNETEFLIFDLGIKDGIKQGDMMSIYRGNDYLGDVKVTRIQEKMSAADFIPPFSSRAARKNDTIVAKQ